MRITFFAILCVVTLVGCGGDRRPASARLPAEAVGDWKAGESGWVVSLGENGMPVSAVHPMGRAVIRPGKTTIVPFDPKKIAGEQVFTCGPWGWEYDPASRELFIRMVIDYKTQGSPADIVGQMEEVLVGPFNEDFTEWRADWFSTSEFVVTEPLSGKTVETVTREDEKSRGTLVFKKL